MPVREALRVLAAEGIVSIEPRRGATVATYSAEQVRELVEVRATLEALNAKLAAKRHDPDHIRKLEQILAAGSKNSEKTELAKLNQDNNTFHEALAEGAANSDIAGDGAVAARAHRGDLRAAQPQAREAELGRARGNPARRRRGRCRAGQPARRAPCLQRRRTGAAAARRPRQATRKAATCGRPEPEAAWSRQLAASGRLRRGLHQDAEPAQGRQRQQELPDAACRDAPTDRLDRKNPASIQGNRAMLRAN